MNIRRWLAAVLVGMSLLMVRSSIGEDSKSAAEALKRGDSLGEKGDFDAAIVAYTEAIHLDGKKAEAFCARGRTYMLKGDVDKAILSAAAGR